MPDTSTTDGRVLFIGDEPALVLIARLLRTQCQLQAATLIALGSASDSEDEISELYEHASGVVDALMSANERIVAPHARTSQE